jgi:hypothetical protein
MLGYLMSAMAGPSNTLVWAIFKRTSRPRYRHKGLAHRPCWRGQFTASVGKNVTELAYLRLLLELLSHPDPSSAAWWGIVLRLRDAAMPALREATANLALGENDARFVRTYMAAVERISARLDRDYAPFAATVGLQGRA